MGIEPITPPHEALIIRAWPPTTEGGKTRVEVAYGGMGRLWNSLLTGCPLAQIANGSFPQRDFQMEMEIEGLIPVAFPSLDEPQTED